MSSAIWYVDSLIVSSVIIEESSRPQGSSRTNPRWLMYIKSLSLTIKVLEKFQGLLSSVLLHRIVLGVTKHHTGQTGPKYRYCNTSILSLYRGKTYIWHRCSVSWDCIVSTKNFMNPQTTLLLKSPPTPPTVISSLYRLEAYQRWQSCPPQFAFELWGSFKWSSYVCNHSVFYADKFTRLFYLLIQLVRVANNGRWCRWGLQSDPSNGPTATVILPGKLCWKFRSWNQMHSSRASQRPHRPVRISVFSSMYQNGAKNDIPLSRNAINWMRKHRFTMQSFQGNGLSSSSLRCILSQICLAFFQSHKKRSCWLTFFYKIPVRFCIAHLY